jgi:nitroreductase
MLGSSTDMDCIEALKTRRSIRAYTGESVSREVIEDILDCGRLAASANNAQPWEFVVITEREMLREIAHTADYGRFIAQAAVCVVVLCKDTKYYLEDGSNASQNILVAARAHGLGACWVAGDKKAYAEKIRKMVGAPEGSKLISLLSIGHPAEEPRKDKRPLSSVVHWEKF